MYGRTRENYSSWKRAFRCFVVQRPQGRNPNSPTRAQYVPDLVVGLVGSIVIARIVLLGRIGLIPVRYWLVFLGFLYIAISGGVLNDLSPDVAVAGIRFYFRYVPLFLLPFAFDYSEKDIKRLFVLIVTLAFIQVPLALRQRFLKFASDPSGDIVTGSMGSSGGLAVLGVALILVLLAFYLDSKISPTRAGVLGLLFLAPASLAEVKVLPFFFFFGALGVLLARRDRLGTSRIIGAACGAVLLIGSFIAVYDLLYAKGRDGGYVELVTSKDRALTGYMLKGMDAAPFRTIEDQKNLVAKPIRYRTEDNRSVGRFDSLCMPFSSLLPSEVTKLLTGLGIGNTFSTFGEGARYLFVRDELGGAMTTISQLIWETGVLGALFFVATVALIGIDSLRLSTATGFMGTVAAAWVGVTAVVGVELVYHNVFGRLTLTSMFFLLSGIIVANGRQRAKSSRSLPPLRARSGVRSSNTSASRALSRSMHARATKLLVHGQLVRN